MRKPAPCPPTSAELAQARILAHQQRMEQYNNERALRHIVHRLRTLSRQVQSAETDERNNGE